MWYTDGMSRFEEFLTWLKGDEAPAEDTVVEVEVAPEVAEPGDPEPEETFVEETEEVVADEPVVEVGDVPVPEPVVVYTAEDIRLKDERIAELEAANEALRAQVQSYTSPGVGASDFEDNSDADDDETVDNLTSRF